MNEGIRKRVAFTLKCKPEEVPDDPQELAEKLKELRNKIKKAKKGVLDG